MLPIAHLVFVSSVLLSSRSQAKTVVMIPTPMRSYLIYHANIGQALIELGHNVKLCVPDYLANQGLVQYKDISIVKYGENLGDVQANTYKKNKIIDDFWAGANQSVNQLFLTIKVFKEVVEQILSDEVFISTIRDLKPDFLILENFMFARNILVLPYKLGIPFGLIGTQHDYFINRVPFSPVGDPLFFEEGSDKKTFLERVRAVIMSAFFLGYDIFSDSDIVTRYAPERPYKTIREIALMAEIFIIELDHILDYPRTTLPNSKLVGGSSVSEAKPLSGDLKTFVEKSSKGTVVVSFGSGDIYVPSHIISKMAAAFQKLDLNFVWKINRTSDPAGNILSMNWIPQNDLLGHPKTKLFISHCGKNGQYEALYHGVPILCIPIYGDQFYNSKRILTKEFGLYADIREISSDELTQLIQQLAHDPKYRSNIQKASKLFKELYKVPSKEAAYWFDHVMKYGGKYMRSSVQEMPLYQFLLLDVIVFILFVVIAVLLTLFVIVRICFKFLWRANKSKTKTD